MASLWAKIDVDYFENPKIEALSDQAQLLHLKLVLLAKKQERLGILNERPCKVYGTRVLQELVGSGLVHKAGPGKYRLHDYEQHQTASPKEARARMGAHTRHHVQRGVYKASCALCQEASTNGEEWLKNPGLTLSEDA
jgi:hypothetical protein